MKSFVKLTSIIIVLLISISTCVQAQDSTYYERLFYSCKAWGHVKYYHTNAAIGGVNWDDELLDFVGSIKNAPDNNSFNQSLLSLLNSAGEMEIKSNSLPVIPDSLNNNNDYSWIQNPIFSDGAREILETIRSRFRPQANIYVSQAFTDGNPTFDADDMYHLEQAFPSEEKRILALFRYWNIINYFFPYKDIMDQDWDATLAEFIPQIIEASDALSYNLAFRRLTTRINDSHAFYYSPSYAEWLGGNFPPFLARFIENEMVITKVLPQVTEVKVGDIIKEIDGENIYTLRDKLREFAYGSNEVIIERELNRLIMRGGSGSFSITVDDGNDTYTEILVRNSSNISDLNNDVSPIWRDTTVNDNCNFGIVDMGRLEVGDINSMFSDLWDTDAIIFDIRNYPNGTLWTLVNYLYTSSMEIAKITVPDITHPGRLKWISVDIGSGTSNPYSGKVILLFDERTQSQAEYTCMGLEQFQDVTKIGSTTSAADGNVSKIKLPGQIETYATFLGIFYPDYTQTQRVGIIPDFEVLPTISGIRAGQDEVLEFALKCGVVDTEELETTDEFKIYPNPARYEVSYDLGNDIPVSIEIYDMQARKIKLINANTSLGRIDISDMEKGIYLFRIVTKDKTQTKLIVKQ